MNIAASPHLARAHFGVLVELARDNFALPARGALNAPPRTRVTHVQRVLAARQVRAALVRARAHAVLAHRVVSAPKGLVGADLV